MQISRWAIAPVYSFPGSAGSAWERIGVEAPASRVHKLRMHFGEAEPRLH